MSVAFRLVAVGLLAMIVGAGLLFRSWELGGVGLLIWGCILVLVAVTVRGEHGTN